VAGRAAPQRRHRCRPAGARADAPGRRRGPARRTAPQPHAAYCDRGGIMSIGARPAARTPETGARAQPWFAHRRSTWYPLAWTPLLLAGPLLSAMVRADAAQVLTVLLLAGLHLATVLLRHRSGAGPATEVLVVLTTAVVVVYQVAWDAHQVFLYPLLALGMATGIRPRRALGVVGALAVSGAVAAGITTGSVAQALVLAVLTYMAGFSAHLIGCLVETAAALAATRERLARAAVVEERERFSRDLHDLLGHTLSVIVVKAEAARRDRREGGGRAPLRRRGPGGRRRARRGHRTHRPQRPGPGARGRGRLPHDEPARGARGGGARPARRRGAGRDPRRRRAPARRG